MRKQILFSDLPELPGIQQKCHSLENHLAGNLFFWAVKSLMFFVDAVWESVGIHSNKERLHCIRSTMGISPIHAFVRA